METLSLIGSSGVLFRTHILVYIHVLFMRIVRDNINSHLSTVICPVTFYLLTYNFDSFPTLDVDLDEVVRCSERVVLAAMAFQAGGAKRIGETKSMSTVGPRPASFIFDVDGGGDAVFAAYVNETVAAVEHVKKEFPNLSLHNRLAIVVPDDAFKSSLLAGGLAARLGDAMRLVSAEEASASLAVGTQFGGRSDALYTTLTSLTASSG